MYTPFRSQAHPTWSTYFVFMYVHIFINAMCVPNIQFIMSCYTVMHNNTKPTICAQILGIGIKSYDEWFTDLLYKQKCTQLNTTHTPAVVACVTTVVSVTVTLLVAFTEMV